MNDYINHYYFHKCVSFYFVNEFLCPNIPYLMAFNVLIFVIFNYSFQRMEETKCPSDEISLSTILTSPMTLSMLQIFFIAKFLLHSIEMGVSNLICLLKIHSYFDETRSTLCVFLSSERQRFQIIALAIRWFNANGRQSLWIKISMWNFIAFKHQVQQSFWTLLH